MMRLSRGQLLSAGSIYVEMGKATTNDYMYINKSKAFARYFIQMLHRFTKV